MILAQAISPRAEHFKTIQEQFANKDPQTATSYIAIVFALLAFGVLLMWLFTRLQRAGSRAAAPHPMNLYWRMLSRLGLPFGARWRLWRLVRAVDVEHPTALLISPNFYDDVVKKYCSLKGISLKGESGPQSFRSLRAKLFPQGQ